MEGIRHRSSIGRAKSGNPEEAKNSNGPSLKVAFVHPDLGIGGAERLVVDAAIALKNKGHQVVIHTSHHDEMHCFSETKDGTLKVRVHGNFIPRSVFGMGFALMAIIRNIYLALVLLAGKERFDVIFVDQLPVAIPLLKKIASKILFYGHFPDKLLTGRETILKRLYRFPIDLLEGWTMKQSDLILVNSRFTGDVFVKSFGWIKSSPDVLYPGINLSSYSSKFKEEIPLSYMKQKKIILSINRFERKKNITLALETFIKIRHDLPKENSSQIQLVLAGGYDPRVRENIEYLAELFESAQRSGLSCSMYQEDGHDLEKADVLFLPSFTDNQRNYLLYHALCLLYTPSEEHFGIVPIEAMFSEVPVIAVKSGGPTETVIDGVTGFLRQPTASDMAPAIDCLLRETIDPKKMGQAGKDHVIQSYSLDRFSDELNRHLIKLLASK